MTNGGPPKHERWSTISFYFYNVAFASERLANRFLFALSLSLSSGLATFLQISDFISSLKTFSYFLESALELNCAFSSVSWRVYELLPIYSYIYIYTFCSPKLGYGFLFLCAGFLPRFKIMSITRRKVIQQATGAGWKKTIRRAGYRKSIFNTRGRW